MEVSLQNSRFHNPQLVKKRFFEDILFLQLNSDCDQIEVFAKTTNTKYMSICRYNVRYDGKVCTNLISASHSC